MAGICIYSMRQNVTDGLSADLRRPPAKQTDEGNLSCGLCFAEQGGWGLPALTIVSVANHLSHQGWHEERTQERSEGEGERSHQTH